MENSRKANALIHEASPYLLQHAYNPVNWFPWGNKAFEKARTENKLVIISIGYSACHWCHVMEHESFEDVDVAAVMNEYFVSVKVDREERPDIDNVYMEAVQIMSGQGGWPLNCVVLPDGRPIYGGTYFPKATWLQVLNNLHDIYTNQPQKVMDYANHLYNGLQEAELIKVNVDADKALVLNEGKAIEGFTRAFDLVYGGPNKAPKFPMPCNYEFLLAYGILNKDEKILAHVEHTLVKMAHGGIYDQLAGGFARYSVDELWKVPHFEKMLYDNGQLIALYAKAYAWYKNPLFEDVVQKTIAFLDTELYAKEGVYSAALDADSQGEEGKFYVWTKQELQACLTQEEFTLVETVFSINDYGYWEHGNYILIRDKSDAELQQTFNLDADTLRKNIKHVSAKLLFERNKRVRPGLDDKCILAWNAMVLKGLAEAAVYLSDEQLCEKAQALYTNIKQCFFYGDTWYRIFKKGIRSVLAFAEDLALLAEALIALYEATFKQEFLMEASLLVKILIEDFYDIESGMFFFTSNHAEDLIVKRTEIFDNVIPAPNSVAALVLYKLGTLLGKPEWVLMAEKMTSQVTAYMERAPQALANWLHVWLYCKKEQREYCVVGDDFIEAMRQLRKTYVPATVWCADRAESTLPLLASRLITGQTTVYDCKHKACNLPYKFNAAE